MGEMPKIQLQTSAEPLGKALSEGPQQPACIMLFNQTKWKSNGCHAENHRKNQIFLQDLLCAPLVYTVTVMQQNT